MKTRLTISIKLTMLITGLLTGCVKSKPVKEPIQPKAVNKNISVGAGTLELESKPVVEVVTPAPIETKVEIEAKAPSDTKKAPPTLADCDTSVKFNDEQPLYLPHNKVVITRIMSPCLNNSGLPGHRKNAGWMAMGFPCTAGEGRIDWKGTNYNRPKMVSFLLETSCLMAPSDKTKIQAEAMEVLGISKDATFIAFNPFVIQYWEVPGFGDADTSFTVDLRSGKGLDDAWTSFIKPKPLRIFLVGRENAWVPGNFMYAVEGDLVWMSKNRFSFKVDKARLLAGEEYSDVKKRCEALKPARDCSRVF